MTEASDKKVVPVQQSPQGNEADTPSVERIEEGIISNSDERIEELSSILISHEEFHSGPVPSPRSLAGYEVVSPGLAREIVDMAVRQQMHDHEMQRRVVVSESGYRLWTLASATLVVMSMIVGAIVLGIYGHGTGAATLGAAGGLVLLAGAFLKGRDLFTSHQNKPGPQQPTKPRRNRRRGGR